jgi:hypothetical protein
MLLVALAATVVPAIRNVKAADERDGAVPAVSP